MSSGAVLMLDVLGGGACGLFFFGGLWWTIGRGLHSAQTALWFLASLLIRSAVVVLGFLWIGHQDWARMLAALLGFIGMRFLVQRLIRAPLSIGVAP